MIKEKYCKHCKTEIKDQHKFNSSQSYCSIKCRFDSNKKDKINDCLIWIDNANYNWYPKISFNNERYYAHRLSCEFAHGPAPSSKHFACHSCDNPKCINPDHLRWGLPQENVNDMMERKRHKTKNGSGETASRAKFTNEQVKYIREFEIGTHETIGKKYGVSRSCIKKIKTYRTYKDIT